MRMWFGLEICLNVHLGIAHTDVQTRWPQFSILEFPVVKKKTSGCGISCGHKQDVILFDLNETLFLLPRNAKIN